MLSSSGENYAIRLVSFNVNGIRASLKRRFGTVENLLTETKADILCLQETKLRKPETLDDLVLVEGYDAYFSTSSSNRGYSGVVTYVKSTLCQPLHAEEGFTGLKSESKVHSTLSEWPLEQLGAFDTEGRVVITHHYDACSGQGFVLFNVYGPAITNEETAQDRMEYKLGFYRALQARWRDFQQRRIPVIVVGDLNIAPAPLDYPDPETDQQFYRSSRQDRLWLRSLLTDGGFKDAFREFYRDRPHAFTVWNTLTNSRVLNYGSRIDLTLTAGLDYSRKGEEATLWVERADIQPDMHGSDHCPVWIDVGYCGLFPCSPVPPPLAARLCLIDNKQTNLRGWLSGIKSHANSNAEAILKDKCETSKALQIVSCPKQQSIKSWFTANPSLTTSNSGAPSDAFIIAELEAAERSKQDNMDAAREAWKKIQSKMVVPNCFHGEPCAKKRVNKAGINKGRFFFACQRPEGAKPEGQCSFFRWLDGGMKTPKGDTEDAYTKKKRFKT